MDAASVVADAASMQPLSVVADAASMQPRCSRDAEGIDSAIAVAVTSSVPDEIPQVTLPNDVIQDAVCEITKVASFVDVAANDITFRHVLIVKHWFIHATVATTHFRP